MLIAITSAFRVVLGFILVAVGSTLCLVVALLLLPWRLLRIRLCNFYGHTVGRGITGLAGVTLRVKNRERLNDSMPAIYVANHTSSLDAFLCVWLCPYGACGIFKKEIVRIPFYGWLAALSGHLLIDRGNHGRAVEALRDTAAYVKRHKLGIWMMPEGTRSKTGELLPFKKGFVHLAIATGWPVVPVVLHGANRNWAKGSWRFVPMTLDVEVLEPIRTETWREEEAGQHAEALHAVFAGALSKNAGANGAQKTVATEAAMQA
jgi:1-acyl-sn-glycerol-3-phosphate acyltransferase